MVGSTDKSRNAADARLAANPSGLDIFRFMRRCRFLIGSRPNRVSSASPEAKSVTVAATGNTQAGSPRFEAWVSIWGRASMSNSSRIRFATGGRNEIERQAAKFRKASRSRASDSPCRASAGARTARPTKNGHAMVTNGIPLSKIHHAAFDAHLIGIDPDYRGDPDALESQSNCDRTSQRTKSVRRVRVTPLTRRCHARAGARTAWPTKNSRCWRD